MCRVAVPCADPSPSARLSNPERIGPVLAFILLLVILWIALGIVGAVIHGLIWLLIIAAALFLATLMFGGSRMNRRPR
jgi:hypothetical protein